MFLLWKCLLVHVYLCFEYKKPTKKVRLVQLVKINKTATWKICMVCWHTINVIKGLKDKKKDEGLWLKALGAPHTS